MWACNFDPGHLLAEEVKTYGRSGLEAAPALLNWGVGIKRRGVLRWPFIR